MLKRLHKEQKRPKMLFMSGFFGKGIYGEEEWAKGVVEKSVAAHGT